MKKIILILWILMIIPVIIADNGLIETYKPNEIFGLSIHLTNSTGDVLGANCSIQIRQNNYSVLIDSSMAEILNGWYNYTYNTSDTGTYFCRQNCTQGNLYSATTCDFIIQGDDSMALSAIIVLPLIVAFMFLVIAFILNPEKYMALKILLILLALVFVLFSYHYGYIVSTSFLGNNILGDEIANDASLYSYVFITIFSVFIITLIYDIFVLLAQRKKNKQPGNYEDEYK